MQSQSSSVKENVRPFLDVTLDIATYGWPGDNTVWHVYYIWNKTMKYSDMNQNKFITTFINIMKILYILIIN